MVIQKHKSKRSIDISNDKIRKCILLTLLVLVVFPASAETVTHTKHVDIWYGSVTATGCQSSLDALESTTHITGTLVAYISDSYFGVSYPDSRVTNFINNWADNSLFDYEWVLAPSENLNAELNLRNKLSLLASQCGSGNLNFDSPVSQGTHTYYLTGWTDTEIVNGVLFEIQHDANGEVSYHELNARFTPSVSVPEFPTMAMPVIAVIGLMFLFQRRKDK